MDIKSKLSKISIKLKNLSENFQCGICQGYIIDATTISECLHSFCKSCIVHFIRTIDQKCPTCNLALKDVKSCIRSDSTLQRLIYQLIPNLLENELDRREKFINENLNKSDMILNEKSLLNLKLYFESKVKNNRFVKEKYIQCVAQTPVSILIKLIRSKYNIPTNYTIKLSYMGHKLNENETLLQLFTSFILTQNDLFEIRYELFKNETKERPVKIECVTDLNENVKAFSKMNIKPETEQKNNSIKPIELPTNSTLTSTSTTVENTNEKSSKLITNKNFLKVKFRNRLAQSTGMSYPSFNLISLKRYQSNKKLRQLKKKQPSKQVKSSDENESIQNDNKIEETKASEPIEIETKETNINHEDKNKELKESETQIEIKVIETQTESSEVKQPNENGIDKLDEEKTKKTSESSDEEDKLLINEDESNNSNESKELPKQSETTIAETPNNESEQTLSKKIINENENNQDLENSGKLDSTSTNSVELPLDLTVQKKD